MVNTIRMCWHLDEQLIHPQPCPVCGKSQQRVVHSDTRPDYVICDACHAAYVMEDGQPSRLLYGQIAMVYAQTRGFALKQWRTYQEIATYAERERGTGAASPAPPVSIPVSTTVALLQSISETAEPVIEAADDPQSLFRRLRETGELPNIDHLFEDKKPKSH